MSGRVVRIFRKPAAIKTTARRRRGAPAARPRGAQAENLGGTRHFSIEGESCLGRVRGSFRRPLGRAACETRHGNNMGPHGFGVHSRRHCASFRSANQSGHPTTGSGCSAGSGTSRRNEMGVALAAQGRHRIDDHEGGRRPTGMISDHVSATSRRASSLASGVYPRDIHGAGRICDSQSATDGIRPPQSSLMCSSAM